MTQATETPIGQTKDAGFEIGVRKTFPITKQAAWAYLFSQAGFAAWLGNVDPNELELNTTKRLADSSEVSIRVFKPGSHIRLKLKRPGDDFTSTLQVRVIDNKKKSTISFHQENLPDSEHRDQMKKHWDAVMDKIETGLANLPK